MLRKLFALTEQGAKDMKKGIIASVFTSLSLMLPMGLLLMLVMQLLQPLLGMETATPSLGAYAGMCLVLLVIIFLTHYIQYRCTYIAAYAESAQRRIGLAEKLRTLPLSFFGKRDLSDLTTTMMSDCNDLERVFAYTIPQIFGTAISCVIVCLCLFFISNAFCGFVSKLNAVFFFFIFQTDHLLVSFCSGCSVSLAHSSLSLCSICNPVDTLTICFLWIELDTGCHSHFVEQRLR